MGYTLCPNEPLACWFFHLLTPGAKGLVRVFESNSRCQTSWYPWVPHVPRDTNWHNPPEMTILENGSLLLLPYELAFKDILLSVLLRDCIKELTFWGYEYQEIQGGATFTKKRGETEENAKISTYWILIVLDFNAFIQKSSRTCQPLENVVIWWWFDMLLLLGENSNLQNWWKSKLSSFVTNQLRVFLQTPYKIARSHTNQL